MSVLIFSKDDDAGVNAVIHYLVYRYRLNVLRIVNGAPITIHGRHVGTSDDIILRNYFGNSTSVAEIESIWLHGGRQVNIYDVSLNDKQLEQQVRDCISDDYTKVLLSVITDLKNGAGRQMRCLGETDTPMHYKINQLKTANYAGLQTPDTFIVSSKQEYKTLREKFPDTEFITKSFDTPPYLDIPELLVDGQRTELLTDSIVNEKDDFFHLSLVQKKIRKQFEVRTFFMKGKLYSMAIFSQGNSCTELDFRNITKGKLIRMVPFNIPDHITARITSFMQRMNLTTGSLDFVVDDHGEFIFLEVNPYGQFLFLSKTCNYHIEKDISQYLAYG